jgi:hypothetical protein
MGTHGLRVIQLRQLVEADVQGREGALDTELRLRLGPKTLGLAEA